MTRQQIDRQMQQWLDSKPRERLLSKHIHAINILIAEKLEQKQDVPWFLRKQAS